MTVSESVRGSVANTSLLMVGAGGIGCELLKNLVLTGFKNIQMIDLDTIDISNLNRQFLFHREHVKRSKAIVAKESALSFVPDANITAHHDTIMNPDYNASYFQQFDIVLNALDNKAARNHVNRMCLAADVPLIESGTAGYLGQVTVIKKGDTECYECQPKPAQKTYPGCTIRNTPSEPVHCIVWAKHLFNQLFGEYDADDEVSPDTEDPELAGEAGEKAVQQKTNGSASASSSSNIERVSTREWAKEIDYDAEKLFTKFFNHDIKYLLSMDKLWQKRTPPTPLNWNNLANETNQQVQQEAAIPDKRIWSMEECGQQFQLCVTKLKERLKASDEPLCWDKDDASAMDFVAATSNIRSHIFHIQEKSRFDIKSISGNIIPAIASTNAIIAGLMVTEAIKILQGRMDECRTVFLNKQVKTRNRLITECRLERPNPKCYVCALKPEVTVYLDTAKFTIRQLQEKIFKEKLGMISPDVEIDDGKGSVLISSEEGETEDNLDKLLSDFKITDGSRLKGDDFLQNFELVVTIRQKADIEAPDIFLMEGELPVAAPADDEKPASAATTTTAAADGTGTGGTQSVVIEDDAGTIENGSSSRKRRLSADGSSELSKRSKSESNGVDITSVTICDDDDVDEPTSKKMAAASVTDTNSVESDDDIIML